MCTDTRDYEKREGLEMIKGPYILRKNKLLFLPKEVTKALGVKPGDEVCFHINDKGVSIRKCDIVGVIMDK